MSQFKPYQPRPEKKPVNAGCLPLAVSTTAIGVVLLLIWFVFRGAGFLGFGLTFLITGLLASALFWSASRNFMKGYTPPPGWQFLPDPAQMRERLIGFPDDVLESDRFDNALETLTYNRPVHIFENLDGEGARTQYLVMPISPEAPDWKAEYDSDEVRPGYSWGGQAPPQVRSLLPDRVQGLSEVEARKGWLWTTIPGLTKSDIDDAIRDTVPLLLRMAAATEDPTAYGMQ